jgi:hypothetical protein
MDQDLRRLAHRALHEACGRGNSPLSAFEWAVSRVRSQRPQVGAVCILSTWQRHTQDWKVTWLQAGPGNPANRLVVTSQMFTSGRNHSGR